MRFFIIVVSLICFNINAQGVIEDNESTTNFHTTQLNIEESVANGKAIAKGIHDKLVEKLKLRDNPFRLGQLEIFKWISANEGHQDILEIAHKIVHPSLLIPAEVKSLLLVEPTDKSECLHKLSPIFDDIITSLKTLHAPALHHISLNLHKIYNDLRTGMLDNPLELRKQLLEDTVIIDTDFGAYCLSQRDARKLLSIDEYDECIELEEHMDQDLSKHLERNQYLLTNMISVRKVLKFFTDHANLSHTILYMIPDVLYYIYNTGVISLSDIHIDIALYNVEILRPSRTNDTIYAKYHEIKYSGTKHKDCISQLHQDPELQNLKEEINVFENSFKPTRYSYLLQLHNLEKPDDA